MRKRCFDCSGRAFTLIELMVVLGVLAVLIASVVGVSSSVLTDAKIRETKAVLVNLQTAVDQFAEEAPLKRMKAYVNRYANSPCDEFEPFDVGVPPGTTKINPSAGARLVVPGGAVLTHPLQDIEAMSLVARLYSSETAAILDRISPRYRRAPDDAKQEFYDRNGNGQLDIDDIPLDRFVDVWEQPIGYYAVKRAADVENPTNREKTSIFLVEMNRGKPVFVSYGPDGPEQCSQGFIDVEGPSDVIFDFVSDDTPGRIDNPSNQDNVYIDDSLKDRLAAGRSVN